MITLHVFGNPYLSEDNLAVKVGRTLKGYNVIECSSPDSLLSQGNALNIIDVVKGIRSPMKITNIDQLKSSSIVSLHDFDLAYFLKIMKLTNPNLTVNILGLPENYDIKKAIQSVCSNFGYTLSKSLGQKTVLAFGAEEKSTFAVYYKNQILVSQTFTNLRDYASFSSYKKHILGMIKRYKPTVYVCDLHPDYNSSVLASELSLQHKVPLLKVQHHVAHASSVACEHNISEYVAIVCDGLGYGDDHTIWGGEVLTNKERLGHLERHLMPGGDLATKHPYRMLLGILSKFLDNSALKEFAKRFDNGNLVLKQIQSNINCPRTSSCGRVLDAACTLLGFCDPYSNKTLPPVLLEKNSSEPYEVNPIIKNNTLLTTPLFEYLLKNIEKDKKRLAATVHSYLTKGLYKISKKSSLPLIFTGGCAYNGIMSTYLKQNGTLFNDLSGRGDQNISLGQLYRALTNPRHNVTAWHSK